MDPDLEGLSDRLRGFVTANPRVRGPHLAFIQREARLLPEGADVLDVGAGIAPFRELFAHAHYLTCDWEQSGYDEVVDIRAPASAIPVDDASFDVVLCTEVLEHVPEPRVVLNELRRILRPGGLLLVTVPFVWFLHEEPHDYYRYTVHGLRFLFDGAGFDELEIEPLGDSFSTLAELVANLGWMIGADQDPSDQPRATVADAMRKLAEVIQAFSGLDDRWILPLGYSAKARNPAAAARAQDRPSVVSRIASRLGGGTAPAG